MILQVGEIVEAAEKAERLGIIGLLLLGIIAVLWLKRSDDLRREREQREDKLQMLEVIKGFTDGLSGIRLAVDNLVRTDTIRRELEAIREERRGR